ncbi:MAG TPA: right-handed parallel beta-helix repeat-containing protein, partial [Leptolyngbyaceae cyanobacterium]
MNTLSLSLGLSLIFATTLITPVVAQTSDSKPQLPSETGSADDLRVSPRGGVGFSTTGSGYEDPFFSLEGFIPLQQSPGSTLTFLEGKLLISTDSTMGGNILLGKRFYSPSQDQILGGYIAYDFRDTGNSFFNQISAGFERLSKNWDLRINGYLPVGNRRQQVAESFSNPTFQENSLLLDRNRQFESAVAGVDLEVGTQLLPLGDGDLRGYAGVYYYNAQGGNDGFGIRGRLEARPSDNLRVGLLVQNDPLFDTRVVLSLGASFPGTRPRGAQRDSTLARIGESVGRTSTITVDEQKELETITATNPTTNEAYRFQHVNLGMGNSDGTFESPFATVQEALAVAQPNDIVYVQAAIDPGIPSFKIPDNVSVLSSGPVQLIDTVEARNVQLPFSGTGLLPTITDTVVLGNNTVLSGFKFLNPAGNAIEGTNVSNLTIRNNQITGAAQSGISLSNVTGTTTLANNSITNSGAGISLNNNIGSVDLNVNGNSLTNNLEHITVGLVDTAVGTVGIVENIVTGGSVGVGVEAGGNSLLDVNIGSNTVNNTTQTGIAVDILGQAQVNATINDNSLTNNLENIAVGLVDTAVGTV